MGSTGANFLGGATQIGGYTLAGGYSGAVIGITGPALTFGDSLSTRFWQLLRLKVLGSQVGNKPDTHRLCDFGFAEEIPMSGRYTLRVTPLGEAHIERIKTKLEKLTGEITDNPSVDCYFKEIMALLAVTYDPQGFCSYLAKVNEEILGYETVVNKFRTEIEESYLLWKDLRLVIDSPLKSGFVNLAPLGHALILNHIILLLNANPPAEEESPAVATLALQAYLKNHFDPANWAVALTLLNPLQRNRWGNFLKESNDKI